MRSRIAWAAERRSASGSRLSAASASRLAASSERIAARLDSSRASHSAIGSLRTALCVPSFFSFMKGFKTGNEAEAFMSSVR